MEGQYDGGNPTGTPDDFIDWEGIPDSTVLPTGHFLFQVEEVKESMSKNPKDGIPKRMLNCRYSVVEPVDFSGMGHFEVMVVGSAEAPTAMVIGSMGTIAFKAMCKACQIPAASSVKKLVLDLVNSKAKFIGRTVYSEQVGGDYAGTPRCNIKKFLKIGEHDLGVDKPLGGVGLGAALGGVNMPAAPSITPPTPQPALANAAAAADAMGAVPTVPKVMATPPVTPETVSPPGVPQVDKPTTAVGAGVGVEVECTVCKKMIPVLELAAHLAEHAAKGEI